MGRITLPQELRSILNLKPGDHLTVRINNSGEIVLAPDSPRCAYCCSKETLKRIGRRYVCEECAERMRLNEK